MPPWVSSQARGIARELIIAEGSGPVGAAPVGSQDAAGGQQGQLLEGRRWRSSAAMSRAASATWSGAQHARPVRRPPAWRPRAGCRWPRRRARPPAPRGPASPRRGPGEKPEQPVLGRRVGGAAGQGPARHHRADVDDGAAALGDHGGQHGAAAQHRAAEVHRQHLVPVVGLGVGHRARRSPAPAAVTSTSTRPRSASARRDQRLHRGLLAHVGGDGQGPPAGLPRSRAPPPSSSARGARGQRHRGPLAREAPRDRAADAATRAGDDGDLAGELQMTSPPRDLISSMNSARVSGAVAEGARAWRR